MDTFKRAEVVMLASNEKATSLFIIDNILYYGLNTTNLGKSSQHLYIISDDEIKEGDWCLNISKNIIYQKDKLPMDIMWKKIIATTDTSLTIKIDCNCGEGFQNPNCNEKGNGIICNEQLPQPSQQFITKYIEEYNKANVIKDVLVEYERWSENNNRVWKPSINQDNTINIQLPKDSYTKDEVKK